MRMLSAILFLCFLSSHILSGQKAFIGKLSNWDNTRLGPQAMKTWAIDLVDDRFYVLEANINQSNIAIREMNTSAAQLSEGEIKLAMGGEELKLIDILEVNNEVHAFAYYESGGRKGSLSLVTFQLDLAARTYEEGRTIVSIDKRFSPALVSDEFIHEEWTIHASSNEKHFLIKYMFSYVNGTVFNLEEYSSYELIVLDNDFNLSKKIVPVPEKSVGTTIFSEIITNQGDVFFVMDEKIKKRDRKNETDSKYQIALSEAEENTEAIRYLSLESDDRHPQNFPMLVVGKDDQIICVGTYCDPNDKSAELKGVFTLELNAILETTNQWVYPVESLEGLLNVENSSLKKRDWLINKASVVYISVFLPLDDGYLMSIDIFHVDVSTVSGTNNITMATQSNGITPIIKFDKTGTVLWKTEIDKINHWKTPDTPQPTNVIVSGNDVIVFTHNHGLERTKDYRKDDLFIFRIDGGTGKFLVKEKRIVAQKDLGSGTMPRTAMFEFINEDWLYMIAHNGGGRMHPIVIQLKE